MPILTDAPPDGGPSLDHEVTCPLCWFAREWDFAMDEYKRWDRFPTPLMNGIDFLLGDEPLDTVLDLANLVPWQRHSEVTAITRPEDVADAAQFIAAFRDAIPHAVTRPRVVDYLVATR